MPQSLGPFAFQLEVSQGLTLAAGVLSQVFKACFADDIQPVVFPPLELFGDTLMADRDRINNGSKALGFRRKAILKPLNILVAPPEIAALVRNNFRLTSVFLFAAACSVVHSVDQTSMLIFEMMTRGGSAQKYAITSAPVFDFVELLNGFRDHFKDPGESPFEIYKDFSASVMHRMREDNTWVTGLHDSIEPQPTAELLFELFDALKMADVHLVELEGSKGGMWIAFLFIWMRPNETEVFLHDACVYCQEADAKAQTRIRVRLQNQDLDTADISTNGWIIKKWEAIRCAAQQLIIDHPPQWLAKPSQTSLPWNTARHQIELLYPKRTDVVMSIGHLSSAIINVATEHGLIRRSTKAQSSPNYGVRPVVEPTLPLLEVCSSSYVSTYSRIMRKFGWTDGFALDKDRQDRMSAVLRATGRAARSGERRRSSTAFYDFQKLIEPCLREWKSKYCEPMLVEDGSLQDDIIHHAINFAAQAVASSLHRESLPNPIYYPLEPTKLSHSSGLLWQMLVSTCSPRARLMNPMGLSIHTLRQAAIDTAIQPGDSGNTDLATARDGYVAFTSALAHEEHAKNGNGGKRKLNRAIPLTEKRMIATIEIVPGCIRHGANGTYRKLAEDPTNLGDAHGGRLVEDDQQIHFHVDGQFRGPTDGEARDSSDVEVKHFVRQDDRHRTIYLTTKLQIREGSGNMKSRPATLVPASWTDSIDAIIFAHHITEMSSRLQQLESLANEWRKGNITVGWHRVGRGTLVGKKTILATFGREDCRFFEAGNIPATCHAFIRHNLVPLTHCVKVSIEKDRGTPKKGGYGGDDSLNGAGPENDSWIIIA